MLLAFTKLLGYAPEKVRVPKTRSFPPGAHDLLEKSDAHPDDDSSGCLGWVCTCVHRSECVTAVSFSLAPSGKASVMRWRWSRACRGGEPGRREERACVWGSMECSERTRVGCVWNWREHDCNGGHQAGQAATTGSRRALLLWSGFDVLLVIESLK